MVRKEGGVVKNLCAMTYPSTPVIGSAPVVSVSESPKDRQAIETS